MKNNPLTQAINFYVSVCFIAVFGLFMTDQVLNVLKITNPDLNNPITNSVQATQEALAGD